jgi:hypothetical protein
MKPTAGFLAMGASAVFQALDPANSGTVSKQAFVQGMTQSMAQFRSGGTQGIGAESIRKAAGAVVMAAASSK